MSKGWRRDICSGCVHQISNKFVEKYERVETYEGRGRAVGWRVQGVERSNKMIR